jgi:hypothetical protein
MSNNGLNVENMDLFHIHLALLLLCLFVCNRGDTILCSRRAPANKRKLGQSPIKD